jgi:PAS domain S-box-containing protein
MNSHLNPVHSIKNRVTLYTLVVFVLCIWSLSFYAIRALRDDLQKLLSDQQFSSVTFAASEVRRDLEKRMGALESIAVAAAPHIEEGPASVQTFLDRLGGVESLFNAGIVAVGPDGVAIADLPSSMGRVGLNLMDRDHIQGALKEGKTTIGKPVKARRMNAPLVVMAAPVRDAQGKIIGSLSGLTDLAKPNFLDIVGGTPYGKTGGYLLVSARHRLLVTATDKRRTMDSVPAPGVTPLIDRFVAGYDGSGVMVDPLGVNVLVSAKRVGVADWYVVASLPTQEAFAPIEELQRNILLATALLTLVVAGTTRKIMQRELAPMLKTAKALAELARSNQPAQSLPSVGQAETDDLIDGFNQLLTTLAHREAALTDSEFRWRFAVEGTGDGLWDWNLASNQVFYSKNWKAMLGYTEEEVTTDLSEWEKRVHPDDKAQALAVVQSYLDGATPSYQSEHRVQCKDGSYKWMLDRGMVVSRDADGKPVRMIGSHSDITERRQAAELLRASQTRSEAIIQTAMDGFWLTDLQGRLLQVNTAYCTMSGYSEQELLGKTIADLEALESAADAQTHMQAIMAKGADRFQTQHRRNDGSVFDVEVAVQFQHVNGGQMVSFLTDITERKHNEQLLQQSLKDKQALLSEVHHRVKNNLQVIISLLRLESGRNALEATKAVLTEMQGRIRSMALLHESLYRSGTFASVDLGDYLGQLTMQTFRIHALHPEKVTLNLNMGSVQVGMDQAIASGLLVNELISNALKHGFPQERAGDINVELQPEVTPGQWRLCVKDSGMGLPADFEARRKTSLGLQLVDDLSRQIGGVVAIASTPDQGAQFVVIFEAKAPAIMVMPV